MEIGAIEKIVAALAVLSEATEPMMAAEVGDRIGMPASNTGMLFSTMLKRKLVEKPDEKENRYRITQKGEEFLVNPPPETRKKPEAKPETKVEPPETKPETPPGTPVTPLGTSPATPSTTPPTRPPTTPTTMPTVMPTTTPSLGVLLDDLHRSLSPVFFCLYRRFYLRLYR